LLFRAINLKVIAMMKKQKSDPFLAQTAVMLVVLLVVYALGEQPANLDHLMMR
jgi:hypothetical protein